MSSTTSNMKKFGRGYVLDFAALMNDVRSPNQKPPDDSSNRSTSDFPTTSFNAGDRDGQSPTNSNHRDFGFVESQHGSGADATPSPTDEELFDASHGGMKRRPARMSVSRTGRLKNRDRQRISVLETSEFYGVKPDTAPLPPVRGNTGGHHPADRDAIGRKAAPDAAVGLPSETLADFDGVIAALDSGMSTQRVRPTNCYSF